MFDPQTELPLNHSNPSDPNHFSYDSYGARIKKTVQKYDTYRSWNHNNGGGGGGGVRFSGDDGNGEESGVCSPPLWKTSSPNHHHNQQQQNNYSYLSPAQKSQAVAKGQRELMEMIRNMPESSYELSLKDLVEYPRIEARHESVPRETLSDVTSFDDEVVLNLKDEKEEEKKKKKSGKKKGQATMRRSGSIDSGGGFLLKMVFPFPWRSSNNNNKMTMTKKKTANNIAPNVSSTCSKVSPRPSTSDKSKILDGSEKSVVDKEWWKKKRLSNSRDSESGGMSSINSGSTGSSGSSSSTRSNCNSNNNNSRNPRTFSSGCWSFFHINKGKKNK